MPGKPPPAGPKDVRELFHYVYKWLNSVRDEMMGGGSSPHPPVTVSDSSTIDFTLAGQALTAVVKPNSITTAELLDDYLKNVVEDLTPELGGNLDGLKKNITNIDYLDIKGIAGGVYGTGVFLAQFPAYIGLVTDHTWNYVTSTPFINQLAFPPVVEYSGVQTIKQTMSAFGGGFLFWAKPIIRNDPAINSLGISGIYALANQSIFRGDTQPGTTASGVFATLLDQTGFDTANGGLLNAAAAILYTVSSAPTIGVNVSNLGTRVALIVSDVTGSGTLTNQAGVVVADLTKGGTSNIDVLAGTQTYPAGNWSFYQGNEKKSRLNGAREYKVRAVAAARTLDATDHCIEYTGAANADMSLPQASTCKGREYQLKKTAAGHPTFKRFAGDTIDGAAADLQLNVAKQARTIKSNGGTDWMIIGAYL